MRDRLWLAILCLYALAHSALYALTNPVFEAPDEPGHLAYANFVAERLALPDQYDSERFVVMGHHWPLYYAATGLLLRASGGPLHVEAEPNPNPARAPFFRHDKPHFRSRWDEVRFFALRLLGALGFALTVLQVSRAARLLLPTGNAWLVAPILVAALPQLAFISGSLSNDGLAALLGATVVFSAVRVWADPDHGKRWIWLGLWAGLAALAKKSALVFAPAVLALPLLLALGRLALPKRTLARGAALALVAGFAVVAPMLASNVVQYNEPLGTRMEIETLPDLVFPQPLSSRHFRRVMPDEVPQSFVARLGWMSVRVRPDVVWPTVRLIFLLAALSLLAFFSHSPTREEAGGRGHVESSNRAIAAFLWIVVLANVAGLVYYNLLYPQPQGRLLFPTVGALMLLCAIGSYETSRRIPVRGKWIVLAVLCLWMLRLDWIAMDANHKFHERQTTSASTGPRP